MLVPFLVVFALVWVEEPEKETRSPRPGRGDDELELELPFALPWRRAG